jgi:3-hydroxyacyl-[acyl-carrier-protein] dehydratase
MKPLELTRDQIISLQCNGDNFLFLDSVWSLFPGQTALASYFLDENLWVFEEHFPGNPVFPASLLLESLTQLVGLLMAARPTMSKSLYFTTKVKEFQILDSARPGDKLILEATVDRFGRGVILSSGTIRVSDRMIAQGKFQLVSQQEFVSELGK